MCKASALVKYSGPTSALVKYALVTSALVMVSRLELVLGEAIRAGERGGG